MITISDADTKKMSLSTWEALKNEIGIDHVGFMEERSDDMLRLNIHKSLIGSDFLSTQSLLELYDFKQSISNARFMEGATDILTLGAAGSFDNIIDLDTPTDMENLEKIMKINPDRMLELV